MCPEVNPTEVQWVISGLEAPWRQRHQLTQWAGASTYSASVWDTDRQIRYCGQIRKNGADTVLWSWAWLGQQSMARLQPPFAFFTQALSCRTQPAKASVLSVWRCGCPGKRRSWAWRETSEGGGTFWILKGRAKVGPHFLQVDSGAWSEAERSHSSFLGKRLQKLGQPLKSEGSPDLGAKL